MSAIRFVVATLALLTLPAIGASHSPDPEAYYFTRINVTHDDPRAMSVIIVPPAYLSQSTMVDSTSWVGADALLDAPGTRAALEATNYWAWMIDQYEDEYPQLARFHFTTKVLGVDATALDVQQADILIMTAMVADPVPFTFHFGLGLPTLPVGMLSPIQGQIGSLKFPPEQGQSVCTVWNTGLGQEGSDGPFMDALRTANDALPFEPFVVSSLDDESPTRTRNLVLHEFGHCLGAGHMGESLDRPHTNGEGVEYENHPNDVLSLAFGHYRQCLSNANVLSLAEGYAWLTSDTATWEQHDAEAYLLKSAYEQVCLPVALQQY